MLLGHAAKIGQKTRACRAIDKVRPCTRQQGGAFVDLVKRVGADNKCFGTRTHYRLGKGEQCLAGAADRQHLAVGFQFSETEASLQPAGNRLAQFRNAHGRRVVRKSAQVAAYLFQHERGRRMPWFTYGKGDGRLLRRRLNTAEQLAQPFEGVGL